MVYLTSIPRQESASEYFAKQKEKILNLQPGHPLPLEFPDNPEWKSAYKNLFKDLFTNNQLRIYGLEDYSTVGMVRLNLKKTDIGSEVENTTALIASHPTSITTSEEELLLYQKAVLMFNSSGRGETVKIDVVSTDEPNSIWNKLTMILAFTKSSNSTPKDSHFKTKLVKTGPFAELSKSKAVSFYEDLLYKPSEVRIFPSDLPHFLKAVDHINQEYGPVLRTDAPSNVGVDFESIKVSLTWVDPQNRVLSSLKRVLSVPVEEALDTKVIDRIIAVVSPMSFHCPIDPSAIGTALDNHSLYILPDPDLATLSTLGEGESMRMKFMDFKGNEFYMRVQRLGEKKELQFEKEFTPFIDLGFSQKHDSSKVEHIDGKPISPWQFKTNYSGKTITQYAKYPPLPSLSDLRAFISELNDRLSGVRLANESVFRDNSGREIVPFVECVSLPGFLDSNGNMFTMLRLHMNFRPEGGNRERLARGTEVYNRWAKSVAGSNATADLQGLVIDAEQQKAVRLVPVMGQEQRNAVSPFELGMTRLHYLKVGDENDPRAVMASTPEGFMIISPFNFAQVLPEGILSPIESRIAKLGRRTDSNGQFEYYNLESGDSVDSLQANLNMARAYSASRLSTKKTEQIALFELLQRKEIVPDLENVPSGRLRFINLTTGKVSELDFNNKKPSFDDVYARIRNL